MSDKLTKQQHFFMSNLAWMELDDHIISTHNNKIQNPFLDIYDKDPYKIAKNYLDKIIKPDYLGWFCKRILNIDLLPIQGSIIKELWHRKFPMLIESRGAGKSFKLGLYALIRALLVPGTKVILTGAGFRQAKGIFEYIEKVWWGSDIVRDMCSSESGPTHIQDRWIFNINNSIITAIPLGPNGDKIRGLRANVILADEFNSIPPDIYETVIQGFASVTQDPIGNAKRMAKKKYLKKQDLLNEEFESILDDIRGNQSIISGTAGYDFQHFYAYWQRWKKIIDCRNDRNKLDAMFGEDSQFIDSRDYSIIRIPYKLIPEGFMDDKQIARARATIHSGVFLNEYGACFSRDSLGFFKRSVIEAACAKEENIAGENWPHSYCPSIFNPMTFGDLKKKYVYGIDPASEQDNFSIVIIELHPEHSRVVYCWTTRRNKAEDADFFALMTRKIRNLMRVFPCLRLAIDTQGGGRTLIESLHDKTRMEPGEHAIWSVEDRDDPKPTDGKPGLHIIEEINFSKADWVSEANHGLRSDLEHKLLLFPRYDNISIGLAEEEEKLTDKHTFIDHMPHIIEEIEELKNELSIIVMSQTGKTGRDHWDVPEIKMGTGKKEKIRKDRYSALLMGNMVARTLSRKDAPVQFNTVGGVIRDIKAKEVKGNLYQGYNFDSGSARSIRRG